MKQIQLLYYALKYYGNYDRIMYAIYTNEYWEKVETNLLYITILDDEYPVSLRMLKKPPYVLFYKGDISLLKEKKCSIVGSRKPCAYAIEFTINATKMLSDKFVVVSGLAKGIDGIAHQSAIDRGKTIAVLGSGINYCYPKENEELYETISLEHLVISEYPNALPPKKYYFPFRNRLIAALGDFLLVTQAGNRSGTMITVNDALDLGKEIYTIPYSIDNTCGDGCNILIEQGAQIILSYSDLNSKFIDK